MNVPTLIRIDSSEKLVIDRSSMMIGRSRRRADFQIDDATVSAVHCELQVEKSGLTVRDMSRHGTLVNGRRVDQAKLHEGDVLEIVGYRFHVTFENSNPPPRKAPAQDEWLVRLAGIELGPMPWDELAGMVERKELQKQDFVRAVTEVAWKNAGELRTLFATPLTEEKPEAEEVSSEDVLEAPLVDEAETETIPTTAELGAELRTEAAVPTESESRTPADRADRMRPSSEDSPRSDTTPAVADPADVDDAPPVINFDEIAEEEVAAVTDEAATQPTFRPGEDTDNPLGDTIVPDQDGTVTDPAAFRQEPPKRSPESEEAPPKPSSAPPPLVKIDGEKLPQTGWMYRSDSGEFGPVDLAGLAELAEAGLLVPGNLVKRPDNGNWLPAEEIPGLFGGEADSAGEGASYDDSSFADLDDELSTLSPPAKETRPVHTPARPAAAPPSPQPAAKQPVAPPPLPALAPRRADRQDIFTKLASPFLGFAGSVMAHPRMAAGIAVALAAVWLFWPGADEHEAYVSGRIQLDGKPLSNAAIMFTDPDAGWGASASLDEDGEFEISTLRGGLQPGRYLISLMPERPEPDHVVKELQRQYLQQTGGLVEPSEMMLEGMPEIPDREGEDTPVELPPGTIPMRFRSVDTSELDATIKVGDNKVSFNLASS